MPSSHALLVDGWKRSILLSLAVASLGLAIGPQAQGADAGTKIFNIPAGLAENSLIAFSTQSGLEIVFAGSTIGKTKTNEVKGHYLPREALDQLMAKTGLIAEQDEKTGALMVARDPKGRRTAPVAGDRPQNEIFQENPKTMKPKTTHSALGRIFTVLAAVSLSSAQAASSDAAEKKAASEEVVELKAFEVSSTKDKGYNVTNSAMALRTDEELMKIPQSISVITRDMMDDISQTEYLGSSRLRRGGRAFLGRIRVFARGAGQLHGRRCF